MTPNWQFYSLRTVETSQGGEPIDIPFGPPTNPPVFPTENPTAPSDDGDNEQPNTHDCGPTGPSPIIWPLDPYNPWITTPPGSPDVPTPPLPPGYGPWWRPPPVDGPVTLHPTGPSPNAPGTPTPEPTPYPCFGCPWVQNPTIPTSPVNPPTNPPTYTPTTPYTTQQPPTSPTPRQPLYIPPYNR